MVAYRPLPASKNGTMKIIVGLSGGVDSAVSLYLLKQAGHEVQGLFMKNWAEDDTEDHCPARADMEDAQSVAQALGVPFHRVCFAERYWEDVFAHFLAEYAANRTPNPDVLCNSEIKFRAFLDHALHHLGAAAIATGHYARTREHDGQVQLLRGQDANKDQSYFLHRLDQSQLGRAVFPLGELTKLQVREIARQQGFRIAEKKDSTGICFIGERRFSEFLARYLPAQPGEIVDLGGHVLGQHHGLMYYTPGQRQGLKIGGVRGAAEAPWFVAGKDIPGNRLIVVQGEHPALYHHALLGREPHWIAGRAPPMPLRCTAKVRYRQEDQSCTVEVEGRILRVRFDQAQRAIAPGQSVVFYDGEVCLGGAVIAAALEPLSGAEHPDSPVLFPAAAAPSEVSP